MQSHFINKGRGFAALSLAIFLAVSLAVPGAFASAGAEGPAQPGGTVFTPAGGTGGSETAIDLPVIGRTDASKVSLPVLTVILGGVDGFNPCAFFVLFFLLSLLIHAHSRGKMLLIGGIFVVASGGIYFLFMSAWLNLFLLTGRIVLITNIAGLVALLAAGINIKDFFMFGKGFSLVIPERYKPRLFTRMRGLISSTSVFSMVVGSAVLAVSSNAYELLCTAGFPMVFTRVLTLNRLTMPEYYLYLAFYCAVYVVPLMTIVLIFTLTLGARKLSEWQGRVLKLVSGTMMLSMGLVLLIDPSFLTNPVAALLILAASLAAAGAAASLAHRPS